MAKSKNLTPIILAVITLIGTLGGAIFSNWDKIFPSEPSIIMEKERWLVIQNVDYPGAVRIKININGQVSSYPASDPWTGDEGFKSHPEKIALPTDLETLDILFTVLIEDPDPEFSGYYETDFPPQKIVRKMITGNTQTLTIFPESGLPDKQLKPLLQLEYYIE